MKTMSWFEDFHNSIHSVLLIGSAIDMEDVVMLLLFSSNHIIFAHRLIKYLNGPLRKMRHVVCCD